MADQAIFKRYEIKYLLNEDQRKAVEDAMAPHMTTNEFSFSTVRNIYYDTDNYRLIRRSIEKPAYKEKLRVRSYSQAGDDDKVFVEIKKKYDKVVYKRRLSMKNAEAESWLMGDDSFKPEGQIANEIEYFLNFYKNLAPSVYLSYDREAYAGVEDSEFRITFDHNIMARQSDMNLKYAPGGEQLIGEKETLMEIKTLGSLPLWMTHVMTEMGIVKTSFSKYGTAYRKMILPGQTAALRHYTENLRLPKAAGAERLSQLVRAYN